jgi:hypothetical protein
MSFRQIIALFMILMSLTAQARTEFACGMNPAAVAAHDCCPPDKKAPCAAGIGEKACCDKVASSDALLSQASSAVDASQHFTPPVGDLPQAFLLVVTALIPSAADVEGRYHVAHELDEGLYRVRPLYLRTARLRL